ncbi:hypothetical protein NMY22_g18900 [Coprinellus aureogranulatus]|nr:hypothetical protein NMY22_g18900 [Coprinellus aureogranulatus]
MKLDNRPKKLVVKGVPPGEEGLRAVKDWYETTGQVDSIESVDDGVVVSFKTRAAAEQALAKGSVLPTLGKVPITWHTPNAKPGTSSATTSSTTPTAASPAPDSAKDLDSAVEPISTPHHREEEEMVVSGWGDEDGDGMGMQ